MNGLIDIGANLTNKSFRGDLSEVIDRSRAAGVETIVVTGTTVAGSEEALELARSQPGDLHCTAGVHPHHAKDFDERARDTLSALSAEPEVVSLGECGLDYDRDFSPRPDQLRAFETQLVMAARLSMPVFLHERSAHADFAAILREHRKSLPAVVVHCFTGTAGELDSYLELDAHIGVTGWICDERRGMHLRDIVGRIPANRLMIETDAPYLLPRTIRPKPSSRRNEPAFLPYVLDVVAKAVGRPADRVAVETTATARAFFRLGAA